MKNRETCWRIAFQTGHDLSLSACSVLVPLAQVEGRSQRHGNAQTSLRKTLKNGYLIFRPHVGVTLRLKLIVRIVHDGAKAQLA
jgi:hypothetical protein